MSARDEIAELDAAFSRPGATMMLAEYRTRRDAMSARRYADAPAATEPAPAAIVEEAPEGAKVPLDESTQPVRFKDYFVMCGQLSEILHDTFAPKNQIAALEARIKCLESAPRLKFAGLWQESHENVPGEMVTWDGSMWHCNTTTRGKPGTTPDWSLVAQRGRDFRPRDR